ncbi:MAG: ABC transporter substrate-binding protein [Kiritimatiellaeota bacterium]|nr:ABC transporter substrate-binding protein [Kiritimatiellota bacterium]
MRRWSGILVLGFLGIGGILAFLALELENRLSPRRSPEGRSTATGSPRRIVCLAPNITETVFALGAGDSVVGVTDFCEYPPAATKRTRVGGPVNPSLERIAVLRPDLLLAQMPNARAAAFCREHGIRFEALRMETLESVLSGIHRLGVLLGRRDSARELAARITAELAAVRRAVAGRPRPRVFVTLSRRAGDLSGLYTVGPGSFLDQLLDAAGADNIFSDAGRPYPEAGKETVQRRAPQIIIETLPGLRLTPQLRRAFLRDWQMLSSIPAVKAGRIFFVTDPAVQIPGPRVAGTARQLARICHPEAFR